MSELSAAERIAEHTGNADWLPNPVKQSPVIGPTMRLSCGHWISVMSASRFGDVFCFACVKWVPR